MKASRFFKALVITGMVAAAVCGLTACDGVSKIAASATNGGVAATIDGEKIMESDITQLVKTARVQQSLTNDDQWGLYLYAYQQTPSDVRTYYIEQMRDRSLAMRHSPELGITLDTAEAEMQIQSLKANFKDEAAWQKSLSDAGWTEPEYRAYVEANVLSSQLQDYFGKDIVIDDEARIEAAKTYVPYYYDGRKRTSHILIKCDNMNDATAKAEARAKAQDVLDQIKAGTISFEDAVTKYSEDTASVENGGDVGYDSNSLVTSYREGYTNLEVGQMSDLVESDYGFHIIKVTDQYNAPDEITSMDQIPEAFRDGIEEAAKSVKTSSAYSSWLQGLRDAASFTQNNMPSGLPYDVDMNKAQKNYETLAAQYSSSTSDTSTSDTSTSSSSSSSTSSSN